MTTTLEPLHLARSRAGARPRRRPADPRAAVRDRSTSGGLAAQAAAARARRQQAGSPPGKPPRPRRDVRPSPDEASRPPGEAPKPRRDTAPSGGRVRRLPPAPVEPAGPRRPTRAGSAVAAAVRAPARLVEERRHLELVEPARRAARSRKRTRLAVAGLFSVCVVAVFGLVALHVVSAEKQFQIDRLAATEQQAQATYEQLRLQADQLDTPQHILSAAQKLGMVQPSSVTFLRAPGVGTGGSDGGAPMGAADWTKMKAVLAGNP